MSKQFYFEQFSLASVHRLVLFDSYISDATNLGVMAMKGYSTLPKAPVLLDSHHQTVSCHIQDTRWGVSYHSAEKQSVTLDFEKIFHKKIQVIMF